MNSRLSLKQSLTKRSVSKEEKIQLKTKKEEEGGEKLESI